MAQEGIATLPMQPMPEESQGIGAFQQQEQGAPEVTEQDRFEAVMQALRQQLPEIADKVEQILDEAALTPEQVDGLAYVVDFLEKNKDNYSAALQSLVQQGAVEEGDFPPQYNEEFMVLLKMVVYGYQARNAAPEPVPFNKGGLAQAAESLRRQGRGGDTILAHINPEEARLLKRMGGSGTINPNTGLPEFLKFKGITKFVTAPIKAVGNVVGGAVKSVVGAANKILGPQLTSIVATVGGFMIGGPAGAALAQGLVTYGSGGSFKDVLLNSATAYIGGAYGPTAGAIAGGGATMLRGGSLKDAIKAAAISYGTSYAMGKVGELGSQGMAPEGADLSRMGSLDANGNFVPDASVATPGSVSAINPTGTGQPSVLTPGQVTAATPSGTTSQFGLNAGPAPGSVGAPSASSGLGSLNFQAPTNYLAGVSSAPSAGVSSLGGASSAGAGSPGFFSSLMSGNFSDAGSAALNYAKSNPMTTAGMILGGTALAGGFTPQPVQPPGLLERGPGGKPITGEDVIAADPSKYIVQNIPGVNYNPQGGIDFTRNPVAPPQFNINPSPMYGAGPTVANSPLYGAPPTYQAPTGSVGTTPNMGIQQPYNTAGMYDFMNYNPYMPRTYNMGGPVNGMPQPEFMPGNSVAMYNKGGMSQYPRRTGQISGPGTETSDDIPAMLSDGEFVITAKAVRGIGNGSRRAGAKKLYRMMHAMEKKAGGKV